MNETMLVVMLNFVINSIDCIMYCSLCNNMIDLKTKVSIKSIFLACLYGISMSALLFYLNSYYTFKIIATATMILILKMLSRKRIHDVLILFVLAFLCTTFTQIVTLIPTNYINLHTYLANLLAQSLTLIAVLLLYSKIPFYKLYNIIEKQLLLKLFIFTIIFIFFIAFSYFNFDYSEAQPYVIYFVLLIIIALIGLYRTIKNIFFYTNKIPMQLHDVKNILMGLSISASSTDDINMIRKDLSNALQIIGIEAYTHNIDINNYNMSTLSFINQKKKKSKNRLLLSTDINYYETNDQISLLTVLYMLGVLLDNSIESGTNKLIFIKVCVVEEGVFISVSNEYKRHAKDDFDKMFQTGYSTKETKGRGYGLPNLSKVVKHYGGQIQLQHNYNRDEECDYLTINITI